MPIRGGEGQLVDHVYTRQICYEREWLQGYVECTLQYTMIPINRDESTSVFKLAFWPRFAYASMAFAELYGAQDGARQ